MVHLTNKITTFSMIMFSVITYFIGPLITRPFLKNHPDQCPAGFLLGFTISVFIWMKYIRNYAN